MLAVKASAYAAAIAALILAAIALLSALASQQLAIDSWLFFAITTLVNFLMIFFVGLLPMPAAGLCRRYLSTKPIPIRFALSLAFGVLMLFLLLRSIETPMYETDGISSVYRHAGPSVHASMKPTYYLYALPVIVLALVTYHWMERRAARTIEPAQPTLETK